MGNEITPSTRLKVEYRKVADLIPYARNARTHSDEQVSRIAGSIQFLLTAQTAFSRDMAA